MFRKTIEVKPSANLKSSERRKLKNDIETQMKGFRVPEKMSKAVFSTPEIKKGMIYYDATTKDPIFCQLRDGNDFIPTLQGLYLSINTSDDNFVCIPTIMTHDAVIDRLMNGANLMIRGCIGPFGAGLKNGAIVAVVNYIKPNIPIAVGECLMDLEGKTNDTAPSSGVAVNIFTYPGDKLNQLGRNLTEILEDAKVYTEKEQSELKKVEEESKGESTETGKVDETSETVVEDKVADSNTKSADDNEVVPEMENLEIKETDNEEESDEYVMSTEDIDEMFKRSVLYTLSQDTIQFPITATQFISGHILKNLPPVDTNIVNMKKTSWKKTAKFLKAMEKDNLLKLKGKDDKMVIVSVLPRSDPRVAEFVPYRIKKSANNDNKSSVSTPISDDGVSMQPEPPLILKNYLKPKNAARMLFNKIDKEYDSYYTEKEIKQFVQLYIKQNPQIVSKKDPQNIEPDDILREFNIKTAIKRADLADRVVSTCSPYHMLYREGDENSNDILKKKRFSYNKGKVPSINIDVENVRSRRKYVTRISGVEKFFVDVEKLADILKVKCSSSSTITEAKDPKDGRIVNIQGSQDSEVIKVLNKYWGIPVSVFVVKNGKSKRK